MYHFQNYVGEKKGQRLSRSDYSSIVNGDFVFTRHEFYNSFTVTWLSEFRAPAEPPRHIREFDTRVCVCRSLYSFYFLACIMHVEASLHCQWRIGKVPPISDRRHFSSRSVCRRFLKMCWREVLYRFPGNCENSLGDRVDAARIHLFRKTFVDITFSIAHRIWDRIWVVLNSKFVMLRNSDLSSTNIR